MRGASMHGEQHSTLTSTVPFSFKYRYPSTLNAHALHVFIWYHQGYSQSNTNVGVREKRTQ